MKNGIVDDFGTGTKQIKEKLWIVVTGLDGWVNRCHVSLRITKAESGGMMSQKMFLWLYGKSQARFAQLTVPVQYNDTFNMKKQFFLQARFFFKPWCEFS